MNYTMEHTQSHDFFSDDGSIDVVYDSTELDAHKYQSGRVGYVLVNQWHLINFHCFLCMRLNCL